MAASVLTEFIRRIGRLANLRGDLASSDEQLLRQFLSSRDAGACNSTYRICVVEAIGSFFTTAWGRSTKANRLAG